VPPEIALFMGGQNAGGPLNVVDRIDVVTTGNASDFGDLINTVQGIAGLSSKTRSVAAGGFNGAARVNVIQYSTFLTTGSFTDFGDLVAKHSHSCWLL
jgi:hypothetical protein